MREYLQILGNVIPLFLLMAAGAAVRRAKVLNAQADRTLLDLLVQLLLPCLILDHVTASEALRHSGNLIFSPLLGFACMAGGIMLAALAARLWRFERAAQARTFAFVTGIFNYGSIPVPLIATLYGANALGVLFLFNLGAETAFWTVGFGMFMGHSLLRDWRRAFTMPVRAILLGVSINLVTAMFHLRLDAATLDAAAWGWPVKVLLSTLQLIGSCFIPLGLLITGATMADFWTEYLQTRGIAVAGIGILVRNIACPTLFVLMAMLLPVSRELKETLVVQAAMPAGIFPLLLARHNGGDTSVALQIIFATYAASIVTLPLWIHFGMQLAGIK